MTAIVGLIHGRKVYLGADSAGTEPYSGTQRIRSDEKVFFNGPYLIAICGSFRLGQLLRHGFNPPEPDPRMSLEGFMATEFVDGVRQALDRGGALERRFSEDAIPGSFLVGIGARLFHIESDLQVGESQHPFDASGSGGDLALGAMWALRNQKMVPEKKLKLALEAAANFNSGVRGPFIIARTA